MSTEEKRTRLQIRKPIVHVSVSKRNEKVITGINLKVIKFIINKLYQSTKLGSNCCSRKN